MFFFVKQKTAYEMRISDWSSDVGSSDLKRGAAVPGVIVQKPDSSGCPDNVAGPVMESIYAVRPVPVRSNALKRPQSSVIKPGRSDERRVGNECVSTCRSRWSPCN